MFGMMDLCSEELIRLLDEAFAVRRTVTAYEVRCLASLHDLGRDGDRGLRYLKEGVYDRPALTRALVDAVVEGFDRSERAAALAARPRQSAGMRS